MVDSWALALASILTTRWLSIPELPPRRVDCTTPGGGSWRVIARPQRRCYLVEHRRSKTKQIVFYETRTERTREQAEEQATAICAVLNALKAKRV